jgi:hypothetical protein
LTIYQPLAVERLSYKQRPVIRHGSIRQSIALSGRRESSAIGPTHPPNHSAPLRAHAHTDPDARRADINAALKLARPQGATLFEQRAALDDFELPGEPPRAALIDPASRIPPTTRGRN